MFCRHDGSLQSLNGEPFITYSILQMGKATLGLLMAVIIFLEDGRTMLLVDMEEIACFENVIQNAFDSQFWSEFHPTWTKGMLLGWNLPGKTVFTPGIHMASMKTKQ